MIFIIGKQLTTCLIFSNPITYVSCPAIIANEKFLCRFEFLDDVLKNSSAKSKIIHHKDLLSTINPNGDSFDSNKLSVNFNY